MRKGRLDEATAIAMKIGRAITAHNSASFKNQNARSGAKELWENVRRVTGKNNKSIENNCAPNITAELLNTHYSTQSTDLNYVASDTKLTCMTNYSDSILNEMMVFYMLDKLAPTAAGADGLPFWLLKLAACSIALPLAHVYNLSLFNGIVPTQWKKAVIVPIAKVPRPACCAEFRPISLTPIPSRLLEKLIVRSYVYPIFQQPNIYHLFCDQFAFRPTGSTEAAIIAILHHVTSLLSNSAYVRIIALDFSKAFDTLRHCKILTKLSQLPLNDQIYNWFVNYFTGHSHVTKFRDVISCSASINASVFQGSAIGPPMFVLNGSDLKPTNAENFLDKYADDTYLIVSSRNEGSIPGELMAIEKWATENNLVLNKKKSFEMIIYSSQKKGSVSPPSALCKILNESTH